MRNINTTMFHERLAQIISRSLKSFVAHTKCPVAFNGRSTIDITVVSILWSILDPEERKSSVPNARVASRRVTIYTGLSSYTVSEAFSGESVLCIPMTYSDRFVFRECLMRGGSSEKFDVRIIRRLKMRPTYLTIVRKLVRASAFEFIYKSIEKLRGISEIIPATKSDFIVSGVGKFPRKFDAFRIYAARKSAR